MIRATLPRMRGCGADHRRRHRTGLQPTTTQGAYQFTLPDAAAMSVVKSAEPRRSSSCSWHQGWRLNTLAPPGRADSRHRDGHPAITHDDLLDFHNLLDNERRSSWIEAVARHGRPVERRDQVPAVGCGRKPPCRWIWILPIRPSCSPGCVAYCWRSPAMATDANWPRWGGLRASSWASVDRPGSTI